MTLVDRISSGMTRLDRRGFLARAAVVGSALAVNPVDYVLRPMTAYAAVCSCVGGCACGSACCDGYTEFCCTLSGRNACPPGTSAAGWWKVDGSGFCGGGPRYYIDCNAHCGGCGCGANGLCSGSCSGTGCGCALGNCDHRATGCNEFRYGQCHQEISCLGPIVCRIVTCLAPWQVDGSCSSTPASDPNTANHDAACLHNPVGAVDSATATVSSVRLTGWALDPDTDASIGVQVYIDGNFVETVTASVNRPDIAAAFPGYGAAHGFDVTVPNVGDGSHQVCVYGVNTLIGAGSNPLLGCLAVAVGNPFGYLDATARAPGGVRVTGWAIDPDGGGPVTVQVLVDGAVAASGTASVSRPDIGRAYPAYGPNHGYDIVAPVPDGGTHSVCTVAVNQGGGTANTLLGCVEVQLVGNPFGYIDTATPGPDTVRLTGWAIDPDTASPISVAIVVDGALAATAAAGGARPDIAAAYPGFGPNHGFDVTVPVAGGTHSVCVVALNTGSGTANPSLGCFTLTVGGNPFGYLDSLAPVAGGVRATGWAIDPDTTNPVSIQVVIDGVVRATAVANGARSDIAAAFPPYGGGHGFDVVAPASAGSHSVCVVAINQGAGNANPTLGCRTVQVS
ncbi:MAG TPA: hypothetical protein VHT75_07125 [Acidimicrobiales bacterium]|nr:hypothetical protein [Acidimicrobiales bacterium]